MKVKFKKIIIGVIIFMIIFGFAALSLLKEVNEEKNMSLNEIDEIQVYLSRERVHFIESSEGSDIKINLHGQAMQNVKLSCEIKNKTLIIKTQSTPKIPLYKQITFDIYIPKNYEKNLSINMSMGHVKIETLSLEEIIYKGSMGHFEVDQLDAKKTSIDASKGKVNIKRLNTEELLLKGDSSPISIDECIVKEGKFEVSKSKINLNNVSGNLDVDSKTGKVTIAYNDFENQNIKIKTTVGSILLELPSTAEFLLEAKTSMGSFKSDFPIEVTDRKNITAQIGSKNNKVSLQTKSGSMKIIKR